MSKKKILFIPSDSFGVGHHRTIFPAVHFQRNYGDLFDIDIRLLMNVVEEDYSKYDIVHYSKGINDVKQTVEFINHFKKNGAITVIDMDDYWDVPRTHPLYITVVEQGIGESIKANIVASDFITTTTEYYANILRNVSKRDNVIILPNAVDSNQPQWKNGPKQSDLVRITWIGGSSHMVDIEILKTTIGRLRSDPDIRDKIQLVMCGYDIRGQVTEINSDTNEQRVRKIRPDETLWIKFEDVFTDGGRIKEPHYVRRNTLPISRYGEHYQHADICLAPLVGGHPFHHCKSELKFIEAGYFGIPLIASNVIPYSETIRHGENGFLVDPAKNHKDWYKYIKQLVLNPELRIQIGNVAREEVMAKYTMDVVNKTRAEFYQRILK